MSWRGLLTLLLLAAAVVSGWSVWTHRPAEPVRDTASGRSDYVLHDFAVVVLDEAGAEAFTLSAPRLQRQPGDASLDLADPTFLFPVGDDDARWEMRAREAWVSAEADEVRLLGDVRADGPGAEGEAASMRTERLDVFPREALARSDERVVVRNGASIIHGGRGLRMDLADKHYQFLADVEFRYVPNR